MTFKKITDPTFRYTSAAATDLRKTFARIERERKAKEKADQLQAEEAAQKVQPLKRTAHG